jgi:hypothetical protein
LLICTIYISEFQVGIQPHWGYQLVHDACAQFGKEANAPLVQCHPCKHIYHCHQATLFHVMVTSNQNYLHWIASLLHGILSPQIIVGLHDLCVSMCRKDIISTPVNQIPEDSSAKKYIHLKVNAMANHVWHHMAQYSTIYDALEIHQSISSKPTPAQCHSCLCIDMGNINVSKSFKLMTGVLPPPTVFNVILRNISISRK